ncbi:3-dehydroquinate synthase [Halalkalibacillus halophilus]|uniref:3-dehydroquinate synthase n=1 Tax=Halalkalibacillus halophilus TaxID=392827 RepID=UPI0003F9E423|nr:3-dehydroquinate synthase [Halalkalibacillus halophilus]
MEIINIKSARNYDVLVGSGIRHDLQLYLKEFNYSKYLVITDTHVQQLYLEDVLQTFGDKADVESYVVPYGEQSKSIEHYEKIHKFMLSQEYDRDSCIIALGGGVVGDLAGFVASTYMRGIGFIQMPTTLLAHDSSVGGKVAINLDETKNIIGQFYPSSLVILDIETFQSLPEKEKRSGLAEVIKHSFIDSSFRLKDIQQLMNYSLDLTSSEFESLLVQSIQVKKRFVESDEFEGSHRKYLNFGHTLGHAVEASSQNSLNHGESVVIGILFALYLSDQYEEGSYLFSKEFIHWLNQLGYQINLKTCDENDLINKMKHDKKNSDSNINFVLLKYVGNPYIWSFDHKTILTHLHEFIYIMDQFENEI